MPHQARGNAVPLALKIGIAFQAPGKKVSQKSSQHIMIVGKSAKPFLNQMVLNGGKEAKNHQQTQVFLARAARRPSIRGSTRCLQRSPAAQKR